MGTRKAASASVGEVQSRAHTQTESEDQFESSSREFSNPNKCHAVTFLFYQINKTQTVTYSLEAIERRVILDPANDFTKVALNQTTPSDGVGRTSLNLLATDPKSRFNALSTAVGTVALVQGPGGVNFPSREPIEVNLRTLALQQVNQELTAAGLLGPDGKVSPSAQEIFGFKPQKSSLPTPGILVKGCLDGCSICEPNLEQEIELDLKRKELENKLPERQIELLDKSQEYRCCPGETIPSTPA